MNCSKYVEHVTANGLNVHIETLDGARSTGVGFFVATGSRDEDPQFAGVSHFLEHMAFKSTKKEAPKRFAKLSTEWAPKQMHIPHGSEPRITHESFQKIPARPYLFLPK